MANWSTLKAAIANIIKTNGNQEITGQLLQNVLNNIVSSVGENSTFAGIATPATNPGVPDGPVFYIATTVGVYANFDGVSVADGEAVILQWNGGAWTKKTTRLATEQEIIYDVSARNGGVVFKSLSALLSSSNLSTLIPTSVRRGGMSIRFIQGSEQSSDNKYVQFRYMSSSTAVADFTNVANWQGVDDEPTAGSKNFVDSNGIAKLQTEGGILVTDYLIPDHNYRSDGTMAEVSGWNCLKKIAISGKIYSNINWSPSARCFDTNGSVIDTITISNGETTLPNGTTALGIYWNGSKTYTNKYLISDSYLKYAVESLKGDILIEKGRAEDKEDYLNTKIGYYVPDILIPDHNYQPDGSMAENSAWDCCQKLPINADFFVNWPVVSARCFNASGNVIETIVCDSKGKMSVPEGTVSVGIYWQNADISSYTDKIIILDNSVTRVIVDRLNVIEKTLLGKKYIKKTSTDLYIVSKLSNTNDIVYHFTKCMANELYTFSEVYLSANSDKIVGTSLENTGTLNDAGSDNIGPIQVPSVGGGSLFVGGNHTTLSQGEVVKTAETLQVRVYVDDFLLTESSEFDGYAEHIRVEVINAIYNPLFPIYGDEKIIGWSQKLCDEKVIYNVGNNNIFVSVSHRYLIENPETVVRYYGMQSHFKYETGIFTPCGSWNSGFTLDLGTEGEDGYTFNKGDYPNFDTFCQVSNVGYEIDYLMNNSFGSHVGIGNNDFIGRYGNEKIYHHLMENYTLMSVV